MILAPEQIHRDDSALAAPRYVEGLANSVYHALPGLSSSMLRDVYAGTVADLWVRRQHGGPPSVVKMLGAACHTMVLEPERWEYDVHVLPEDAPRTKTKRRDAMVADALAMGAQTVITPAQVEVVAQVTSAVMSTDVAASLLADCPHREPSLTWRHASGHVLRVRPDALGARLADMKTGAPREDNAHSVRSWRGQVFRYGYHLSAAMYRDVVRRVTGHDPGPMVWIVASTKPPYTVQVYECGEHLEQAGRAAYEAAIERYDAWFREAKQRGSAWAGPDQQIVTIDIRGGGDE